MASASSRMMSLNVARCGDVDEDVTGAIEENICFVEENVLICSL